VTHTGRPVGAVDLAELHGGGLRVVAALTLLSSLRLDGESGFPLRADRCCVVGQELVKRLFLFELLLQNLNFLNKHLILLLELRDLILLFQLLDRDQVRRHPLLQLLNAFHLAFDQDLFVVLILFVLFFGEFHLLFKILKLFFEGRNFLCERLDLVALGLEFGGLGVVQATAACILAGGPLSLDGPLRSYVQLPLEFLYAILRTLNVQFQLMLDSNMHSNISL
jgi:hypothetical protein